MNKLGRLYKVQGGININAEEDARLKRLAQEMNFTFESPPPEFERKRRKR
jgi:hypothetical protein